MYLKDCFKLAFVNILRKKGRFFLSAISISIGIATVIFITCAGNSGMNMINGELSKMGLNLCIIKSEKGFLKNDDIVSVQAKLLEKFYVSSVVKIPAEINMQGFSNECVIYGGDEEILRVFDYNIELGRNIRSDDLINYKKIAIIDNKLAERMFLKDNAVGEKINLVFNGKEETFTIVGITDSSAVKTSFDKAIPIFVFVPHTTLKKVYNLPESAELYTLSREGTDETEKIINAVNLINKDKSSDKKLIYKEMNTYKRNIDYIINIITLILAMIGGISLISGGIGVVNTMIMSVSERRGEIGIKKALGQNDFSVVMELICEAVISMLAALIIGLALGITVSYVSLKSFDMQFIPDVNSILIISVISLVMGIIFGFLPAVKTFSMNPVEILK